MKKSVSIISLFLLIWTLNTWANTTDVTTKSANSSVISHPEKTLIINQEAKKRLLGKHLFSLQWISWDYFGQAIVSEKDGLLHIKGKQVQKDNNQEGMDDYVILDGIITEVGEKEFTFHGEIKTKIYHLNDGEECLRKGKMTFKATGKRQYWRLQEMDNPCSKVVDYVDIYYRSK